MLSWHGGFLTIATLIYSPFYKISDSSSESSLNRGSPEPLLLDYVISSFICFLFDLFLYFPSAIFQLNRDRSSWAEPVLS